MRVVRNIRVPTGQLKGHLTSSQGDHWDLVHSDQMVLAKGQAGEAGPVEQCSAEAKSLKTKGQGTVRLPSQ
jgi:hypothetical protein